VKKTHKYPIRNPVNEPQPILSESKGNPVGSTELDVFSDSAPHTVLCANFPNENNLENTATTTKKITSNPACSRLLYYDFLGMLIALNT
jgi:hypothetical protein